MAQIPPLEHMDGSWLVRIQEEGVGRPFVAVVRTRNASQAIRSILAEFDTGSAKMVTVTAEQVTA
jgi:hypothetical protein